MLPSRPVEVAGITGVKSVAGGYERNLAVKRDGTVWEWGFGFGGSTPVQVSGLTGVVAVAPGWMHALALKGDGTVWAWGDNSSGRLGDGTIYNRPEPVQVAGLAEVVAIAAGITHSLAVKGDGTVWAWGDNSSGQLGDETPRIRTSPVRVIPPGSPDLTIEMSHDGDFSVGAPGLYMLTVTNTGAIATSGTIAITDVLPPGLAYVSAIGSEWNCTAGEQTIVCTNPSTVSAGDSSTVWLRVDVGPAAAPGVTNLATVSNESDRNISNNTIGDPTFVLPGR
jgi:uncharacterized repeat protein (TIGR01451 family)